MEVVESGISIANTVAPDGLALIMSSDRRNTTAYLTLPSVRLASRDMHLHLQYLHSSYGTTCRLDKSDARQSLGILSSNFRNMTSTDFRIPIC